MKGQLDKLYQRLHSRRFNASLSLDQHPLDIAIHYKNKHRQDMRSKSCHIIPTFIEVKTTYEKPVEQDNTSFSSSGILYYPQLSRQRSAYPPEAISISSSWTC